MSLMDARSGFEVVVEGNCRTSIMEGGEGNFGRGIGGKLGGTEA